MSYTVITTKARWVCDHCGDEQEYTGPGADERARIGGALHKCPRRAA